ncbi:cell division protein FtsQ/DivIB [Ningiella sp. W23]|uniref:cell division protein FtsQ/DivIB n=1 Tax=Ningiella sp. W23 TaxID=3023715 RepID=UPI0037562D8C
MPIGLTVFFIVLTLLAFGAYKAYEWLQDEQRLPVQNIVFTGQLHMLDSMTLEALIRDRHQGSFFAIDVNHVHNLVEQQPWVYSASIRKRWPSSLYIHIVEQEAVARWNDDLLLNQYADSFAGKLTTDEQADSQLPVLFGPGGSEGTALKGYQHMSSLLKNSSADHSIAQLVLSERFAWTVQLKSNITLYLGREEYIKRLQRFIDVYPLLKEEKKAINYVDLRYDTGLAVGWGESDPTSQAETENNINN